MTSKASEKTKIKTDLCLHNYVCVAWHAVQHKPSLLPFTCNLQALANQGGFYFSQSSPSLCSSRQRLSALLHSSTIIFYSFTGKSLSCFSWRTEKLYLASRDGTSHYGHAATSSRQVDPPKFAAIHRSNRAGSSLSSGPSFPLHTTRSAVDRGSENAGFESKTSTAVNQQLKSANTSTATQRLRVKISAKVRC